MKLAGKVSTWAGGLVVVMSLFLHYYEERSLWSILPRAGVFYTLLVLAAVTFAILAFFFDSPLLVVAQAALGVYIFGLIFPLVESEYRGEVGFWLSAVGSLAMAVGGGLSLAAVWPRSWPSVTGWGMGGLVATAARSPAPAPPGAPSGTPPAGWYPNPSGEANNRYWTGTAWTDSVMS